MKNTNTAAKPRRSNVELLRIILSIGVVLVHSTSASLSGVLKYTPAGSANAYMMQFICTCFMGTVDVFFMLTGYFSLEKNRMDTKKPILLAIQLIIMQLVSYIYLSFKGKKPLSLIGFFVEAMPQNWFIILYIGLILIAPFLSALFTALSKRAKRQLIIVLMCLYSLWPSLVDIFNTCTNMSIVSSAMSIVGDAGGYSIVVAVLSFFIGAALRDGTFSIKRPWLCYAGTTVFMYVMCYVYIPLSNKYNSPFIIFAAASLLSAFLTLDIKENKVINYIARSTLMVYLMHLTFIPQGVFEKIAYMSPPATLGTVLLICIAIFVLCFAINEIYNRTIRVILNMLVGYVRLPIIEAGTDVKESSGGNTAQ